MGPFAPYAEGCCSGICFSCRWVCRILCERSARDLQGRAGCSGNATVFHSYSTGSDGAMNMPFPIKSPRKLIEVALPLDAINVAAAREKSIRHGHPSTLHLWWARRPLAAARAVIFAQLVHDPEDLWRCQNPGQEPNQQVKGHWTKARARLFKIIEDLVIWENTTK